MATKRLFVAINFPDEVKSELTLCIDSLKSVSKRGNFSRAENLHLTLAFIGETDREQDIIKVMDGIKSQPFILSFCKTGKFAHNRGDLYWLGTAHSPELFSLQSSLTKELIGINIEIEKRDFRPHVTLAREVIAQNPVIEVPKIEVKVDSIELMQSVREDGKLKYIPLYSKLL